MLMQHYEQPAPLDTCSGLLFEAKKKATANRPEHAQMKTPSDNDGDFGETLHFED